MTRGRHGGLVAIALCATGCLPSVTFGNGPDAGTDAGLDADVATAPDSADVPTEACDGMPCEPPPPRQIAPLSTSRVYTPSPTLHWQSAAGASAVQISVCRDRRMTQSCTVTTSAGASQMVGPLAQGVWFWSLKSESGATIGSVSSSVWEFTVGPRGTSDTSFGISSDFDGDGLADVLAGGVSNTTTRTGELVVVLHTGSSLATPTIVSNNLGNVDTSNPQWVAAAGDVNGDGFGDAVVAVARDTAPTGNGEVLVFLGGPGGLTPVSTPIGVTVSSLPLGLAVAGVGDVNRDGYGDVVVGEPGFNSTQGAMVLLLGRQDGNLVPQPAINGTPCQQERFGSAVAAAGDVDGDGFADVIVGAPAFRVGAVSVGRVALYMGSSSGLTLGNTQPQIPMGATAVGEAVAGGGDIDGDGKGDFVVAAPGTGSPQVLVYVSSQPAAAVLGGTWTATTTLAIGDMTGDGFADVFVGKTSAVGAGNVSLFAGSSNGVSQTASMGFSAAATGTANGFAASIAVEGDINGDLNDDLVVGAPTLVNSAAEMVGGVIVYAGGASQTVFEAPTAVTMFGTSVALGVPSRHGHEFALATFRGRAAPWDAIF